MSNKYVMDYDWLWGRDNGGPGNDGTSATVRLTVRGKNARQAVQMWLADIPADALGVRGRGGWMVKEIDGLGDAVIVDITSGGEDVADGIQYGTEEAFEVLDPFGLELEWKNMPRGQ